MKPCPNCRSDAVYAYKDTVPFTGEHLSFLPGLGTVFAAAHVTPVLCADCGLARYFATDEAREKVTSHSGWEKL